MLQRISFKSAVSAVTALKAAYIHCLNDLLDDWMLDLLLLL